MKRKIILLLFCLMLTLTLAACQAGDGGDTHEDKNQFNIQDVYTASVDLGFTGTLDELIAAFKGDSAYTIAVSKGYAGTEAQWLDSLVGAAGSKGDKGDTGQNGLSPTIGQNGHWFVGDVDTGVVAKGENGTNGSNGTNGKSAYELYIDKYTDYQGDEEQWLDDLLNGRLATVYCVVDFDTCGGGEIDSAYVSAGGKVSRPADPIRTSHVFDGWYVSNTDFSADNRWSFIGYIVTENMTLYAKWTRIIPNPTIPGDPADPLFFGLESDEYNEWQAEKAHMWTWIGPDLAISYADLCSALVAKGCVFEAEMNVPTNEDMVALMAHTIAGYIIIVSFEGEHQSSAIFLKPQNLVLNELSFEVEPDMYEQGNESIGSVYDWAWNGDDLTDVLASIIEANGYQEEGEAFFTSARGKEWRGTKVIFGLFSPTTFAVQYFDGNGNMTIKIYWHPKGDEGGDDGFEGVEVTDAEIRLSFGEEPDICRFIESDNRYIFIWNDQDFSNQFDTILLTNMGCSFDGQETFKDAKKIIATRIEIKMSLSGVSVKLQYYDGNGNMTQRNYSGDNGANNVTDDEIRNFFGIEPDSCWSNEVGNSWQWKFDYQDKFDDFCALFLEMGFIQAGDEWSMEYDLSGTDVGRYINSGLIRFRISYSSGNGTTREAEFHFYGEGDGGFGSLSENEIRMLFGIAPDHYNFNNQSFTHYGWEWRNQNLYEQICATMLEKGYTAEQEYTMSDALEMHFTRVEHNSNSDSYSVQYFYGDGTMIFTWFYLANLGEGEDLPNENGVYVYHILIQFSDEQKEYLNNNMYGKSEQEKQEMYINAAQSIMVEVSSEEYRAVYGAGGILEEIEVALNGLTGQAALDVFSEYILLYNTDPGMVDNERGYFIRLEGENTYMQAFTDLALELFNPADPDSSVGNAFINGSLGWSVSAYGVHVLMIKSVYTPV